MAEIRKSAIHPLSRIVCYLTAFESVCSLVFESAIHPHLSLLFIRIQICDSSAFKFAIHPHSSLLFNCIRVCYSTAFEFAIHPYSSLLFIRIRICYSSAFESAIQLHSSTGVYNLIAFKFVIHPKSSNACYLSAFESAHPHSSYYAIHSHSSRLCIYPKSSSVISTISWGGQIFFIPPENSRGGSRRSFINSRGVVGEVLSIRGG